MIEKKYWWNDKPDIGSHCLCLCPECLDELVMHIAVVRGAELSK